MPRIRTNQLTARKVETISEPGNYVDGDGLRLKVTPWNPANKGARRKYGTKSWILRYTFDGTVREMGLGPARDVSLAAAREKARSLRDQVRSGIDPIARRDELMTAARLAEAKSITFKECAEAYIQKNKSGWKNDKHRQQWANTLRDYAYEVIGDLPVAKIDKTLVLKVIEPYWKPKEEGGNAETASRVRARIENVLDWAKAHGYREGDNPAKWSENLEHALPKRSAVQKVKHHAALPYVEVASFIADLRARDEGIAARAFEFIILTAVRTSEALEARWNEIDFKAKVWTVPAERMKAGKEHRVPLSDAAIRVLRAMEAVREDEWVFPGQIEGKPLSNMACLSVRDRMGREDITVHGFRSTFRTWAAEQTGYPREVVEMALAHVNKDKVEAAYQRGEMFEKRARLMNEWARYCDTVKPKGEVVPMRKRKT